MKFIHIWYTSAFIITLVVVVCFASFGQTTVVRCGLRSEKLANTEFDPAHLKFELVYNVNTAICKFVNFMPTNEDPDPMLIGPMYDSNIVYYTELDTKKKIANTEFSGTNYNILLNNYEFKWNITNESRIINNFKCFKATTEYLEVDKGQNIVKTYRPIVWFTPEIPTSFGFQKLSGLPGLMIEGTIKGDTYFYALTIERNVKNITIEMPKAPVEMTEDEWDDLMGKMYKEIKTLRKE